MTVIHPAVVHLPIALMILSVVTEVWGFWRNDAALRQTAWVALLGAAVGGILAVPLGIWDMTRLHPTMTPEIHEHVEWHETVGYATLAAVAGLTLWRGLIYQRRRRAPGWGYLVIACLGLALTLYQGWLGGELVFRDGVGVHGAPVRSEATPSDSGREPPSGHPH